MQRPDTNLKEFVKEGRFIRGISQRTLAKEARIGHNTIVRIEKGGIPDVSVIIKLSDYFGVDPDFFFDICLNGRIKRYIKKYYDLFNEFNRLNAKEKRRLNIKFDKIAFDSHLISHDIKTPQTGEKILRRRNKLGLDAAEVAKRISLRNTNELTKIEMGDAQPSLRRIFALGEVLDISPKYIFDVLVKEKIACNIRTSRKYYNYFKNGFPIDWNDKEEKKERKERSFLDKYKRARGFSNTEMSDLFYSLRIKRNLSRKELANELAISLSEVLRIEKGTHLPSFKVLLNMHRFFGIDLEELFDISIRGRVALYRSKYRQAFDIFLGNKEYKRGVDNIKFFSEYGYANFDTNRYPRMSSYLKRKRLAKNMTGYGIAKKIGISKIHYRDIEQGKKPVDFLIICACEKLFGDDIEQIFDMVLEEKIEVHSRNYKECWYDFLEREGFYETASVGVAENNELQMA